MAEYKIEEDIYEVDKELERAIIKRYLERRYNSVLVLSSFTIGFLLGVIAYAL